VSRYNNEANGGLIDIAQSPGIAWRGGVILIGSQTGNHSKDYRKPVGEILGILWGFCGD
jgi:hypothetical protein